MTARMRRLRTVLITITVCITFAVPSAYFVRPHVERWARMRELSSDDLAVREQALNYVIRLAPTDDRVIAAAASRIGKVDDTVSLQIFRALEHAAVADDDRVLTAMAQWLRSADDTTAILIFRVLAQAGVADRPTVLEAIFPRMAAHNDDAFRLFVAELDAAGVWGYPEVPIDLWMRSIGMMLDDADPIARVLAVHRLADLHLMACDPTLLGLLGRAVNDDDAPVRYAAVLAAAELAGTPAAQMQRMDLEAIVARGTEDADPAIARDAWLLLAVLDPWSGFTADWRSAPPEVAEAILYAALKTNPGQPQPALEALNDSEQPTQVRAAAAYAMHLALNPSFRDAERDAIVRWRLMLSAPIHALPKTLDRLPAVPEMPPVELPVIQQAELFRLAAESPDLAADAFNAGDLSELDRLAILESAAVDQQTIAIPPDAPDMHRLAAVAVTRDPQPADLHRLLAHEEPAMRDLACIVAAQRFTAEQNDTLIRQLLRDYNDDAKISGAILAGLTGLQRELLAERTELEDMWPVQQMMKLGRWMQGELPEWDGVAATLMSRDDLPQTTVLLALLHRDRAAALDYLLNPRGEPPVDLLELLDFYRWNRVLRYFIPDAPPLWHWADPHLKQFQIDVLRNWWLVRRGGEE